MRDKVLNKCQQADKKFKSEEKAKLITDLTEKQLDDPQWHYRKADDTVDIGGKLSEDLNLFYSVDDVRTLFNWRRPEYQNICKLMS